MLNCSQIVQKFQKKEQIHTKEVREERLGVQCSRSCVRQGRTPQHDCLLDAEAVQLQQVVSHGTATRGGTVPRTRWRWLAAACGIGSGRGETVASASYGPK